MAKAATHKNRALIVGGSIAGLFAALLLRRIGWRVDIFERTGSELFERGAGIVTHKELLDLFAFAGIDSAAAMLGVSVPGRIILGRDGGVEASLPLPQVVTSWSLLYQILRQTLPDECYHHHHHVIRVEQTEDSVCAHFESGASAQGDLLIGADGIFSNIRRQLLPAAAPAYVGYFAWRGTVEEQDLSRMTQDTLCDHFGFSLLAGEQMLGYPIAGVNEAVARGKRRFNFVWYRPATVETLPTVLTDVDGVSHSLSIPPNKIRSAVIAGMREDAERLLAPQFAEVVQKTKQPFIQTIQDLEVSRMNYGPRIAIIGDAAFVARPHVGMGVTKAAGDAAALVRAIEANPSDLARALAGFESERLGYGAAVVRRARDLGAYLQPALLTDRERIAAELYRQPKSIMAETAVNTGMLS